MLEMPPLRQRCLFCITELGRMYGDGSNDLYQNLQRSSIPACMGRPFCMNPFTCFQVRKRDESLSVHCELKSICPLPFCRLRRPFSMCRRSLADIHSARSIDTSCTGVVGIKLNTVNQCPGLMRKMYCPPRLRVCFGTKEHSCRCNLFLLIALVVM